MLDPETCLILFLAGGIGTVGTYALSQIAIKMGPEVERRDLLPMAPWEGPPLPRFFHEKPELVEKLKKEIFKK